MHTETARPNALVPLILRLAVAAVFIYHGVDKIAGKDNELGAAWAHVLWARQGAPPADLEAKLASAPHLDEARFKQLRDQIREAYASASAQEKTPESLQFAGAQMAVAWGELLCGLALLVGLLTRPAALAMIIVQAGAIATVTWGRGFAGTTGAGYEYNLLIIAVCVALALSGGGALSLDRLITERKAQRKAAAVNPTEQQVAAGV